MTLFNIYVYFLLLLKTLFIMGAVYVVYLKRKGGDEKTIEKIEYCIKEGFSIIHISQTDIWSNTYDWKRILQNEIERLDKLEPQCRFISSNSIYKSHISKLSNVVNYTVFHPTT